ncbi:MAG TPA: deoxyribonuclease IV [Gemmatimonadaceae bacterium]|nr:deoxyribonuclease IV [Gemmatimonadaceae bacterium]
MHIFGTHPPDTGGMDMAVRRSANAGMIAVQIFTAIPKFYGDKSSIRGDRIDRFKAALADTGMSPKNVMAHGAYVLNVSTSIDEQYSRASGGLTKELERSTMLGLGQFCFHPGAAVTGDLEGAYARVARAITHALETVPGTTRVLVENTAGAGRTVGRTPKEIGTILAEVPKALRYRTGYGLDTCHLFAAGFEINKDEQTLKETLDAFEEATGEPPSFFHLNDSEGALGSNRDRHMLLGEGQIGVEAFRWLLRDRRTQDIPLILETPQLYAEPAKDDATADPYDVKMLGLLKSLE